ncbi:M18 family aminopeptidase [Ruicaihuangia caeni]|uniref:M18 family aminopeptidase n=1 Tax=Ruicaihuangia caeni TaxID=3042517 RepID=A0AAW6TE50_9MICO|nr:M18 family aminopeptidase [Klugiella sp. YN-L-19]MDI2099690.1 M18 family aminopeptidase [Klugiella sp. YN-L-19]
MRDLAVAYADDLAAFIEASPSSYHAAAEVARRLEAAGFVRLLEHEDWSAQAARIASAPGAVVIRDGAVIAWRTPETVDPVAPFRIIGAHTDSPGFKLKPNPSNARHGWLQAGVEVYGGPLLNSWLDRELELAGRIVTRGGAEHLVRTGPLLRIPQLAIHLDRDANQALTLDRQRHVQPVWGTGSEGDLLERFARSAGVLRDDVVGFDLLTADTAHPARFGAEGELFAAGRLDNLVSVHAGVRALLEEHSGLDHISVLAAFDHEELGSESRSGASGPFLDDVLTRVVLLRGGGSEERARALAGSWCLSADTGHAVHPNYAEKHDPDNQPRAGGGPLLKLNANQRYASDAHGTALWARVCEAAGVKYQEFVSNNAVPCGSTIGPLTATRLGIRTVDVGAPLLSMHSARELCHVDDAAALGSALAAFAAGA